MWCNYWADHFQKAEQFQLGANGQGKHFSVSPSRKGRSLCELVWDAWLIRTFITPQPLLAIRYIHKTRSIIFSCNDLTKREERSRAVGQTMRKISWRIGWDILIKKRKIIALVDWKREESIKVRYMFSAATSDWPSRSPSTVKMDCDLGRHSAEACLRRLNEWSCYFLSLVNYLKQASWRKLLENPEQEDLYSVLQALLRGREVSSTLRDASGLLVHNKGEQAKLLFEGTSVLHPLFDVTFTSNPRLLN